MAGRRPHFPEATTRLQTYFTADTHFGHSGALALYRRPFADAAEMDVVMLQRWNETVEPSDEVWHLGDFAVRQTASRADALLRHLHGRKHLLTGNNDPDGITRLGAWSSVQPYVEITVEGAAFVLCHYAFRTWNGMGKGCLNLHGHRLTPQPRQVDVGVDVWDFRPVTLTQIRARLRLRRSSGSRRIGGNLG